MLDASYLVRILSGCLLLLGLAGSMIELDIPGMHGVFLLAGRSGGQLTFCRKAVRSMKDQEMDELMSLIKAAAYRVENFKSDGKIEEAGRAKTVFNSSYI